MDEVNASFLLNLNNDLSSCLLMPTIQISFLTTRLIEATECELKGVGDVLCPELEMDIQYTVLCPPV